MSFARAVMVAATSYTNGYLNRLRDQEQLVYTAMSLMKDVIVLSCYLNNSFDIEGQQCEL